MKGEHRSSGNRSFPECSKENWSPAQIHGSDFFHLRRTGFELALHSFYANASKGVLLFLALVTLLATGCFPKSAGVRLSHFESQAPAVGEPAPGIHLTDLAGRPFELEEMVGHQPIVLQLGSHSCPVYRYRRHWMSDLMEDYGDRVTFLLVYTIEAHPAGASSPYADREWRTWINRVSGIKIDQPDRYGARHRQAEISKAALGLTQRMLVDTMDNAVWQAYGAASSPAFVIDTEGKIAAQQVWIDPEGIRQVLDELLSEPDSSNTSLKEAKESSVPVRDAGP